MKNTLLKKLLFFTIPIATLPLLFLIIFNYMYLHKVIENEVISTHKKVINHIANDTKELFLLTELLKQHLENEDKYLPELTILDSDWNIILQNFDPKNIEKSNIIYNKEELFKYIQENENDDALHVLNNKANQILIKPLLLNGKIDAFIISHYKNSIDKKLVIINQTFLYMFFVLIFIVFIIAIFILTFSMKLLNPLKELIDGVKNVKAGNLSFHIKNSSDDDIGVLIDTFNEMTIKLKKTEDELKLLNSSLELKIESKTQELQRLNDSLEARIKDSKQEVQEQGLLLIQQSRLAQMGELVSMIAHQWRQPLSAISAISSTLTLDVIMDTYEKEFFQERLESVNELSQHLSSTINDFRDFFKSNKEKEEAIAQDILQESAKIIAPTIDSASIELEFALDKTPIKINTFANEVKQVILNLLKNAEDVLIEKEAVDAKILLTCYRYEDEVIFEIEDNGGGISKEVIEKIFDPYFSTKKKKDGTGLGLYMSKIIIEQHCEGELSVSNTDKGAKFTIKLAL